MYKVEKWFAMIFAFLALFVMGALVGCGESEEEPSKVRMAANAAIQSKSITEYWNVEFSGVQLEWSMGKITGMALTDVETNTYQVSGIIAVRDTNGIYYHNQYVTSGQYIEAEDEFILLKGFTYIDAFWDKSADNPLWK